MSDATIQAAIQSILQALDAFADADVTLGDTRVLGNGSSAWAIVYPGPVQAGRSGDWAQMDYTWTHRVEIWQRFSGDDYANIVATRQVVLDAIGARPTLEGTTNVVQATITEAGEPMFLWAQGQTADAQPQFVGFNVEIRTRERASYGGSGEFTT